MKKLFLLLAAVVISTASCQTKHKKAEESTSTTTAVVDSGATSGLTNEEQQQKEEERAIAAMPDKPYVVAGQIVGGKGYSVILDRLEIGKTEPLFTQDLNQFGEFRFTGTIKQPELFQLRLTSGVVHFIIKPGENLYFTLDMKHPENFQVEGSLEPIYLRDMYYTIEKTNDKISAVEELQDSFSGLSDKSKLSRLADTLPRYYARIDKEKAANLRKFAKKVDTAFVALLAAGRLDAEDPENFAFLEKIDAKFAQKYPHSPFYRDIHNKVVTYAPVSPGHLMPDILATDAKRNSVRLSSFKGKTVLVYFWNSGCTECISDFPKLSALYSKYKAKGFEILGVSLDKDPDQWQQAVTDNHPAGTQVIDPGMMQSASAQTLLISTMPYNFLIDKEGRIVSKKQNAAELEKTLKKIFGS